MTGEGKVPTDLMATIRLIDLGPLCNNRCLFCAQGDMRIGAKAPEAAQVLAQLSAPSDGVCFVGGEPTLHAELAAWIDAARARGHHPISLQTNGRQLAVQGYAERLLQAGLTHLEVSLQGHESALVDYHTQTPGSFRQAAKGLLNMRDRSVMVGLSLVITRSNYRHLEAAVALARQTDVHAMYLSELIPVGAARTRLDQLKPDLELVRPWLERAADRAQRSGLTLCASPTLRQLAATETLLAPSAPATFPFASIGITAAGLQPQRGETDYQDP